jgi:hypothetical protein
MYVAGPSESRGTRGKTSNIATKTKGKYFKTNTKKDIFKKDMKMRKLNLKNASICYALLNPTKMRFHEDENRKASQPSFGVLRLKRLVLEHEQHHS